MITFDMNLFSNTYMSQTRLVELIRYLRIADNDSWHIGMHQHDDFCEWEYVVSGSGRYEIDSRVYEIHSGDMIFINRGVAHSETSNPESPLISWKISCSIAPLGDLPANVILPTGVVPVIHTEELGSEIQACCNNIYHELVNKQEDYETMVILLVERYCLLASRVIRTYGKEMKTRNQNLAMQIKQYLDLHYADKITLDSLAERMHVSKYYVVHEMKREYKCSPIDYLIHVRLGEAQNLLNTTELTVSEISRRVGYDNVSYFNTLFARKTGTTPTEFRNRNFRLYHNNNNIISTNDNITK